MKEDRTALRARPWPLKDGSGWYVEVTLPDSHVVRVGHFGLETTAQDWIDSEAAGYVRDVLAH